MSKRALVPYGGVDPIVEPYTEGEDNDTTTAQSASSSSTIVLNQPWKKQKTDRNNSGSSYVFEPLGRAIIQDPRLAHILPPTNIPLPTAGVTSAEDISAMVAIDKVFMALPGMPKAYQKRITVRDDDYLMSYGWEYTPDYYLDITTLSNLKNTHPAILQIFVNPTGGCCSKESNKIIGIATPCYCDNCAHERGAARISGSNGSKESVPSSPKASWGRFLITVQPASRRV